MKQSSDISMYTFRDANIICASVVGTYGIALVTFPTIFFSHFIYRPGFWRFYLQSVATGGPHSVAISEHILKGVGLTWISWALLYACLSANKVQNEAAFVRINAIIWGLWCILDHWVRKENIYSALASLVNLIVVTGIFAMWLMLL